MKFITELHLVLKLGMCGAVHPLPYLPLCV